VKTDPAAWSELLATTETLDRLRREVSRCVGASAYRNRLQQDIHAVAARRSALIERLCEGAGEQN
jgi:nitrogen-specific signal transduction histidine kinase